MTYRVRSHVGDQPLPGMDVTTNSARVAAEEARTRAAEYPNGYADVSLLGVDGPALRGPALASWVARVLER